MRINIKQLEIASCLYHHFSSYDESYEIVRYLSRKSSLSDKDLKSLIEWLRSWGCRQFEKSHFSISRKSLILWLNAEEKNLPKIDDTILNFDFESFRESFETLVESKASKKKRIGPVGASKILFALRPNVFAPWDNSIISYFRAHENVGSDYIKYMEYIRSLLLDISAECKLKGIAITDLPLYINRNKSSLPKIIDEYFWITIAKGFKTDELIKLIRK